MTLAGSYAIGPSNGSLSLRTSREGVASAAGHDLRLSFERWSGQVTIDDADLAAAHLDLDIEVASLQVLEGTGGVAALSADDIADITATALKLLDAEHHPHAVFASTAVEPGAAGGTVAGTLTIRGESGPLTVTVVETAPHAWRGTATVQQTAFGIKPYRAFFGALRLADPVAVEVTVDLSAS